MKLFQTLAFVALATFAIADVQLENSAIRDDVAVEPPLDLKNMNTMDLVNKAIDESEDSVSYLMKLGPVKELTTAGCLIPLMPLGMKVPLFTQCLSRVNEKQGFALDECQKEIYEILEAFQVFYDKNERKCGKIVQTWFKKTIIDVDLDNIMDHLARELFTCKGEDKSACHEKTKSVFARILATVWQDISFLKDEGMSVVQPLMSLLPRVQTFAVCMNDQPLIIDELDASQKDRYLRAGAQINSILKELDSFSGALVYLGMGDMAQKLFNIPFEDLNDVRKCKEDGKVMLERVGDTIKNEQTKDFLALILKTVPVLSLAGFKSLINEVPTMVADITDVTDALFFNWESKTELLSIMDDFGTKLIGLAKMMQPGFMIKEGCDGEIVIVNGERNCVRDESELQ